jgi:type IV secretion system protein VirB10
VAPELDDAVANVAPASPEGFRLEGDTPRVMRLSRKTLAIAGGVAGTAIGGALLWALQPTAPKSPDNLYRAESRNRADVVTSAPADYGAVPKLGPPLPGDLGRPIVSAQAKGETVPVPPIGADSGKQPSPAELAQRRAEQERETARGSRLFLGGGGAATAPVAPLPALAQGGADQAAPTPGSAAKARRAFLAGNGNRTAESSERIREASSPRILQAGSIIPAALITAVHSDLPGQVTAQVTQNVYDSPTGALLLIPQGSRLVGEYDSEVASGQSRVLLVWDRLILADGRSIHLDRQPGADAAGKAGLSGHTNYHWGQMLRAALVSTLLGVGTELGSDSDDRLARALRDGSQDTINQAGRQLVERQMAIPPTITVPSGAPLRVIVTRDLILDPLEGGR